MATVTKIPATVSRYTATPIQTRVRRKVAASARVSTDHEDQLNSYEAQCDYYTTYIQANDEWEFAGVYSDEGISGTSTRRRDGFNRMVEDALAGRIGLILTKSVSRFARNTVDSLTTIRKLKEHGTEVYFEKENIWTFDSKGELLLTIMSSLAQEESRSISLNVTWGQRKRFADGKASAPFSVFLGYDRGEHGEFVVNLEQAEIIKIIYGEFLKGFSFKAIAKKLTAMGIKSPKGKDVWNESTVKSILTNVTIADLIQDNGRRTQKAPEISVFVLKVHQGNRLLRFNYKYYIFVTKRRMRERCQSKHKGGDYFDKSRDEDISGAVGRSTRSSERECDQIFIARCIVFGDLCDTMWSRDIYRDANVF